ncbi:hypothetical protein PsorP6_010340 [Peronosclerospora sorghi]|uniref:Uncharacterized protein n=1 Tax=Peronosclerospora sorghi TaxID=230839 RepID=A0ACC0VXK0_9STRA|nr:hypothetical protein PsorP6_010340 [Peronosclerospora sorghi]
MGIKVLGVFVTILFVMGTPVVSADDMATNSSLSDASPSSETSANETVLQLLEDVQTAVADDPALTKMFNISNASELSDDALATRLRGLLNETLSDSSMSSASSDASKHSGSRDMLRSGSGDGKPNAGTRTTGSRSLVLITVAALVFWGGV